MWLLWFSYWLCLLDIANCVGSLRCDERAEIVLALDRAISDRYGWNCALQYLSDITGRFEIGPDRTQVGVVTYDDSANVEFHLNNHTDRTSVMTAIVNINYRPHHGLLNFVAALRKVRNEMFMPVNGARAGACKVLVMVAFCNEDIHLDNLYTLTEASALRSTGVKIIMVGLTSRCSRYLLPMMATRPTNYTVFWFTSPKHIFSTINEVVSGTCEMAKSCGPTNAMTTNACATQSTTSVTSTITQTTTTTRPTTTRIPAAEVNLRSKCRRINGVINEAIIEQINSFFSRILFPNLIWCPKGEYYSVDPQSEI